MSQELIKKELQPIATEALTLKVKSHGDLLVAADLISSLNRIKDRIEEEKQKVLAPLNEARTAEIARWKPALRFYEEAINHIRSEMGGYQTKKEAEQKAKEQKIADDLAKGKLDMDQAVAKMERLKTPEKSIVGAEGEVEFRKVQKLKVTDVNLIPREYLIVDEGAVMDALKQGLVVPGAEIEIVQVPYNFR